MIEKHKISRYLFYAFGEIILVVIGILIALQINNWNEGEKIKQKEQQALSEVASDVRSNMRVIDNLLNDDDWSVKHTIQSINVLMDYIKDDKMYNDSLSIHFNNANRYEEFNPKTSGYESLSSTGMDLISNPELRSAIGEYFTSTIENPKIAYGDLRDDYYHYMLDYVRFEFTQIYNKEDNTFFLVPHDFEVLKDKLDFLESLKIYLDVNHYYRSTLEEAYKESQSLLEEIKTHI